MRFRLRTLLIVLAILPPLLGTAWMKYAAWRAEYQADLQRRKAAEAYRRAAALKALVAMSVRLAPPPSAPAFRKPPGNSDYQFPPQPRFRISDEERPASRDPIGP
jgi:hypothetical protein